MDIIQIIVYGSALLLGAYLGRFAWKEYESGKKGSSTAKAPLIGGILAVGHWMPESKAQKNQVINKLFIVVYTLMAIYITPFFFLFLFLPVLYDIEWISD